MKDILNKALAANVLNNIKRRAADYVDWNND